MPDDHSPIHGRRRPLCLIHNGLNRYIQSFDQRAAGVLASHFSASVTAWEIWNEPNAWSSNPSLGVYTGSSFMYPSNFAQLLTQTRAAVKSAAPGAIALSGGLLIRHCLVHRTTGVSSAVVQAQNLEVAYRTFMPAKTAYVARAYWYRTQDLGVAADYYGLVDTNGGTKAAYTAYQQYAAY
jgi:hypothetical protein